MREEITSINGGYYAQATGYGGKKLVWEFIEDKFFRDIKENDVIGLWGFDFNFLINMRGERQ